MWKKNNYFRGFGVSFTFSFHFLSYMQIELSKHLSLSKFVTTIIKNTAANNYRIKCSRRRLRPQPFAGARRSTPVRDIIPMRIQCPPVAVCTVPVFGNRTNTLCRLLVLSTAIRRVFACNVALSAFEILLDNRPLCASSARRNTRVSLPFA